MIKFYFKNKCFILSALCVALVAVCVMSCDEGDIQPRTIHYNQEGRTLKFTGRVSGLNTWSSKFSLRVAAFSENSAYAILSKSVTADSSNNVNVVLSNIPDSATKVELCVLDRLRQRTFTLQEVDITNVSDTVYMTADDFDASMFAILQQQLFDQRCVSCHRNSDKPAGSLNLAEGHSYNDLVNHSSSKTGFESRIRVKPYDGANSLIYQLMCSNLSDWHMPHADIIKEDNIKSFIKEWIDNGAKE